MAEERVQRRLTAILAADVAGYSRLIGIDEEGTLAQLKALRRELVEPNITTYRGRIVKTTGDGILIEFASVVDAARCAIDIQRGMRKRNVAVAPTKRIEFRIGINVGDVVIEDGDLLGDGVNVAARLESIAQPGGICISDDAYRQVRDKLDIQFEDAGEQQLKNIERPVRVYRLDSSGDTTSVAAPALALPDKPSIAVLPFQNMSGDQEQEYFADGIVEEIITALSRFQQLFVIARNSSFTYKGRAVDVKQVGRELGVRYVLEGSVRKAAERVRITGQLIDAATGAHLWADHFEDVLQNIFDLQDQVTASVVGAIVPKLEKAEIERVKYKPTQNLDAYDQYLRALASYYPETKEANEQALRLAYKAIELDPSFAPAYGIATWYYVWRKNRGWIADRTRESAEVSRLVRRAAELGKDDAVVLAYAGFALAYVVRDLEGGAALCDRSFLLNPNSAVGWYLSSWIRAWLGEPEIALKHAARAMRLSPLDPQLPLMQAATGFAHFFAGRYDEACSWAEKALRAQPDLLPAIRTCAASHALAGRHEEAQTAIAQLLDVNPTFRISDLREVLITRRSEDFTRYEEGLRKAGLPE
jgi:TolB-like protein